MSDAARVLRKLFTSDVESFDRQIADYCSKIRTMNAQIETLEAYRRKAEARLAELGDDDDPE